MDDQKKTLAAITLVVGFLVLVVVVVGMVISGRKVVSPVPEENEIKIIFVSPTPLPAISPSQTPAPTPKK